ncbi:keratin, type I cytoskeletal 18 [Sardina pilchardus]|uniref:keratin, type I cytoskeletal 18 n=1 Tax=Sardina pilchardus TaxID=27697 RepID=UPI002E0FE025
MSYFARSSTAPRNFSSSSASGSLAQRGVRSSAASVFGGAGGIGSRISVSNVRNLSNMLSPHVQLDNGKVSLSPANEKETMRGLNDRLSGYLSKVRTLEESNQKLEDRIKEVLSKRGTGVERDWSAYEQPLATLKEQLQDMTMENARLLLQIDNARLAADDFKVKFENEQGMRQGVEQDIAGLRKLIDETHMSRMQLESQIESMTEELVYLKKNHEEDVDQLRGQISNSNVSVEMDNRKGDDLNETINKIRNDYEKAAKKNREDTETWYQSKFDNITAEVTQNTEALQTGKTELNELRRQKQALEIDVQALHNMNRSLEDTLADTQNRSAREMTQYNKIIVQLEDELGQVRAQVERQRLDYQTLLNLKMKLESEIATYHSLLEGEGPDDSNAGYSNAGHSNPDDKVDFSLEQALQAARPPASLKKVLIISQEIVDGEVVSENERETILTQADNYEVEEEEEEHDLAAPESVTLAAEEEWGEEEEERGEEEDERAEEEDERAEEEEEDEREEESETAEQQSEQGEDSEEGQLSDSPPAEDEAAPDEEE